MVLELEADRPCDDDGAICTSDGKRLSNRLELTVPGPAPANEPASVAPTFSGTAQVGETLTAFTSDVADNDGLTSPSYTFECIANDGTADSIFRGATSSTYTLVSDDVAAMTMQGKSLFHRRRWQQPGTDQHGDGLGGGGWCFPLLLPTARARSPGRHRWARRLPHQPPCVADTDGLTSLSYAYPWLTSRNAEIAGATEFLLHSGWRRRGRPPSRYGCPSLTTRLTKKR